MKRFMENLGKFIMSKEIESVNKNLSTKKCPGTYSFTSEFYQAFHVELTLVIHNFQEI